jgi:ferric-dicitrate binding protein FerR (iron transport regulator)
VSSSRAASEATRWVIEIQTSRSIEELWPAFEAWLLGDQENWSAFLEVQQAWSRWDRFKVPMQNQHPALFERLRAFEHRKKGTRTRGEILWLAAGISLLALLLL